MATITHNVVDEVGENENRSQPSSPLPSSSQQTPSLVSLTHRPTREQQIATWIPDYESESLRRRVKQETRKELEEKISAAAEIASPLPCRKTAPLPGHHSQHASNQYRDYSRVPVEDLRDPSAFIYAAASAKEPPFPVKLHRILCNPDFQDIVAWLPHGRSWRVLKPKAFEEKVIPLHFRHCRYSSFMRQVNGWGFKRVLHGPDLNSYYHELFLRGLPHLCLKMRRPTGKQPLIDPEAVKVPAPDFYSISAKFPLPDYGSNDCPPPTAATPTTSTHFMPNDLDITKGTNVSTDPGASAISSFDLLSTPHQNFALGFAPGFGELQQHLAQLQLAKQMGIGNNFTGFNPALALLASQSNMPLNHNSPMAATLPGIQIPQHPNLGATPMSPDLDGFSALRMAALAQQQPTIPPLAGSITGPPQISGDVSSNEALKQVLAASHLQKQLLSGSSSTTQLPSSPGNRDLFFHLSRPT